jgi:hypothetical protein
MEIFGEFGIKHKYQRLEKENRSLMDRVHGLLFRRGRTRDFLSLALERGSESSCTQEQAGQRASHRAGAEPCGVVAFFILSPQMKDHIAPL